MSATLTRHKYLEACCGECDKQWACGVLENSLPACPEIVWRDESAAGMIIPPEAIYAAYSEKLAEVRRERDELAEDLKAAQGHITVMERERNLWKSRAGL